MTDSELTEQIKSKAIEAGFQSVGVVPAEPLNREGRNLKQWLRLGYQGEMNWMGRNPAQRSDPTLLLPGAKSVVVVAMNYYTPHEHENDPEYGKISRYAWGDDYHDVIKNKLWSLLNFMAVLPWKIQKDYQSRNLRYFAVALTLHFLP